MGYNSLPWGDTFSLFKAVCDLNIALCVVAKTTGSHSYVAWSLLCYISAWPAVCISSPAELPGLLASCWALNQCDMPDPTQSFPCTWERTAKQSHSCSFPGGIRGGKRPGDVRLYQASSTSGDSGPGFQCWAGAVESVEPCCCSPRG